jgi:hypothetical protein
MTLVLDSQMRFGWVAAQLAVGYQQWHQRTLTVP